MTDRTFPAGEDDLGEARRHLRQQYGFAEFRPGQAEAVRAVLRGEDLLLVMPTGAGKSLCYQLPALMVDGITLVISPLIALMKDQVDAIARLGVPAAYINSSLDGASLWRRLEEMSAARFKLVYVAPERFSSGAFVERIGRLAVSRVAVDEAHCISQWGHDFRPSYLRLREALAAMRRPPVLALTATATPEVRQDIVAQLGIAPERIWVAGFDRPNLRWVVRRRDSDEDKLSEVVRIVRRVRGPAIVYTGTRKLVEMVAATLRGERVAAARYHAGMEVADRSRAQEDFLSGRCAAIVATNAFGMGIDKRDVRCVVHHMMPAALESYYQEAGRAGRDGKPAYGVLLYGCEDRRLSEFFIEGSHPPSEVVSGVYAALLGAGGQTVALSPRQIQESLSRYASEMAITSALRILRDAGVIAPLHRGTSRPAWRLRVRVHPHELPVDFAALEHRLEREYARLGQMERYATGRSCRRQMLLRYFGDAAAGPRCRACDVCCDWR